MQKSSLYITFGLLALLISGFQSCKKPDNNNNNGTVIATPYTLYFSDSAGALYTSNDGKTINKGAFPPDGYPSRAIWVSNNTLLWSKINLYFSNNNGLNFNHAYDTLRQRLQLPLIDRYAINGTPIDFNQSMMAVVPGSPNVIYTCSGLVHDAITNYDYLGVAFNNNDGVRGNWTIDNSFDTTGQAEGTGTTGYTPVVMTSFALLPNGTLCGLALNIEFGDSVHQRNFYLSSPANVSAQWSECTGGSLGGPSTNSGTPLPPNATYLDTGFFSLGHYGNRLIAIDVRGVNGAWYSDDKGANWKVYSGLPAKTPLLCVYSPFEQVSLIGTDSAGLYMFNVNANYWQPVRNGLPANLVVRGITAKENIFVTGAPQQFVYIATNQGIYQSSDLGFHWIKTIPGNFVGIY